MWCSRAGGRAGRAQQLHGKTAHEKAVGHGLIGGQVPVPCGQAVVPHALHGLGHDVVDLPAEMLPGEEVGHPPLRQGHELAQHIPHAADRQAHGGFGNDVQIRHHQDRRAADQGLLIALPGHGRHGGAEAVAAGGSGDGDEGQSSLFPDAVADDVVDGAAADGDQQLHIRLQLLQHLRRGDLRGVQAPGVQDDLLLCRRVPQAGDGVGAGVVDRAAFAPPRAPAPPGTSPCPPALPPR